MNDSLTTTSTRMLDAHVAKRVFGPPHPRYEIEQHIRESDDVKTDWYWVAHDRMHCGSHIDIPHYSTDIRAAMLVVEHMRQHGEWRLVTNPSLTYAEFIHHGAPNQPYTHSRLQDAPTLPMAICLAAIAAIP